MPHIIVEYSDNLDVETKPLMRKLQAAMVATGSVNLKGLKCRSIKYDDYVIADEYEGYKFLHVELRIRGGRTTRVQQDMTQRVMDVLEAEFGHLREDGYLSLGVDLREMEMEIMRSHHNFPVGGVKTESL